MNNSSPNDIPGYLPIEDYGIIGDLNTIALVSLYGSVDFMCFPDFDSPAIFASLLDKDKGGRYSICPARKDFKSKQLYLPETNILITRFLSEDGIGELTDFMPVQELNRGNELIRRVTTIKGSITYQVFCGPGFNYAAFEHQILRKNHKEMIFTCKEENIRLRLKSTVALKVKGNNCFTEFTLGAGESADFMFLLESKYTPEQQHMEPYITESLKENIKYWKNWSGQSSYKGRWMGIINRSALVLKMLTSYKYGSLVAAPTFGLPEEIGGQRNWDYRFTWIRDASFTVYCLLSLGYSREAGKFIDWVENRCFDGKEQRNLQVMYKLNGDKDIKEKKINYLEGYKNSKPVRIGNAAYKQMQLDIYGELLDAVYFYDKDGERISYNLWLNLSAQINWLAKNWRKKDDSIWEVRGGKRNFLYSRLMCWVAFDRIIKIAKHHSFPIPLNWKNQRDQIFTSIHSDFWNEGLKSFVQYNGADTIDASSLLLPIMGFIGPKDPKWLSTLKCIEHRLADEFLVYRYRDHQNFDGMSGQEGTFSVCAFWFIECLSMAGELDKAQLYFEKMLGYANHLGLYSEQLGNRGGHLGNYPQALTHLGLISTALNLDKQLKDAHNKRTD